MFLLICLTSSLKMSQEILGDVSVLSLFLRRKLKTCSIFNSGQDDYGLLDGKLMKLKGEVLFLTLKKITKENKFCKLI